MDFLANLIKRPNSSITQTENNTESKTESCINAATSSSVPTLSESSSKPTYTSTSQITLAMNRCNIDTDFDKLFDSAVQDINNMEEQHNQIIENTTEPVDCVEPLIRPNTSQETISQLLHDMNVNLDQVSEYEMEHLQAMSLEFSPLAVRPSPRHSMEQQKALIAAMRSPSQPSTPTTPNSADPLRSLDVEPPMLKFIGLPEFDETQIPELATELSSNMDPLSCTVLKVGGEQDYNSDSEIYAECVSLNSAKFSADHSELDAYSSALNVLDNNLFNATATTLDNTLSEAAASVHNDSCEPMDIDDINETMELLRDVLAPEDCKLVQESCLGGATKQSNESVKELKEDNEPKEEQVLEPTIKEQSMQQANPAPISTKVEHQVLPQEHAMPKTSSSPISPPLPTMQTIPVEKLTAAAPVSPKTSTVEKQSEQESAAVSPCTLKVELPQTLNVSPPIPTHRPKTAEELAELRALEAYAEPPVAQEKEEEQKQVQSKAKEETQKQAAVSVKPIASVEPIQSKQKSFTALELNISHSTLRGENSAPSSPSFPMKSPAVSPTQFPRSPYAPVEHDMPYLEVANIEASAEHKVSPSGVIGKSAPQMQVTITEASPEQVKEETPLNGTFDSGNSPHTTSIDTNADATRRATFGVPLDAASEQKRRTFTMIETQTSKRRTMTVEKNHTSPALEATEENIMSDELEPMDVDVSMRVDTNQLAENQTVEPTSSPLSTQQAKECQPETHSPTIPMQQQHHPKPLHSSPPLVGQLKRPSIHKATLQPTCPNATVVLEEQTLSVKEQLSVGDEKDVYVDHFGAMSPITDDIFKPPQYTSSTFSIMARSNNIGAANAAAAAAATAEFEDSEFQDGASNNNIILNSSDLDYLFTKGSNNAPIDRSSLLLKFDPLLGAPVPVNHLSQQEQTLLSILSITGSNNSSSNSNNNNNNNITRALSPTLEEHETSGSNHFEEITKKHANMSVDVIGNDCNKTFDDSNLNSEEKTHKYHNMDELEKKIKNEVTRSEDIENKLREAEQREEALVKRITEKDKNNAKLNGVIEAYEKAIAELIHDKEQLVQNHERQMAEVQADRDSNYTHLMSLETTFSDLHVKYEKSKEMTSHLKQIEENLLEEKKKLIDKLRQQEQRYEQMKSHAMQQMEIANKKLCTLTKEHTDEVKKLKALLKKEEVSRISTAEQLQQKSRENADLLKICEELIYDKGQGGSS